MKIDLSRIKLSEATLQEYSYAIMNAESESLKEVCISDFFKGKDRITIIGDSLSEYEHRKIQNIWQDFFKNNGWTLFEEISFGYMTKIPVKRSSIEISPGIHKKIYRECVLFYTRREERIVIEINKEPREEYIYIMHSSSDLDIFEGIKKVAKENNVYIGQKIDCRGNFLNLDNIGWDDVILPEETKHVIISNVDDMFSLRNDFKKFGLSVKRGIILYGVPGTGKTKICKCLAKNSKYSVLYTMPSDFTQQGGIKRVCDMAQDLAPCLLIIEDIDWIAQDRSRGNAPFVMELMNKLDGLESFGDIITLGTTNALGQLEQAIKNRPGRFDRLISIDVPTVDCIEKMILKFTEMFILSKDVNPPSLARALKNLTGAHVYDLCNTAAINAVKDKSTEGEKLLLKRKHFEESIKEVQNKDFSSYMEMQSKATFGFGRPSSILDDYDDELL